MPNPRRKTSKKSKTSKPVISDRALANKLVRSIKASGNPDLQWMIPHVAAGLRIVKYMFDALEASTKVKSPKGISVGALELRAKDGDTKAENDLRAADWMLDMVMDYIGYKEPGTETAAT